MGKIIYVNGELLPDEEAKISVFDRGFLYGDGLFETIRLYSGMPFLLEEHLKRLCEGASFLKFRECPKITELREAVRLVVEVNPSYRDGVIRLTLTRGRGGRGLSLKVDSKPSFIIAVSPFPYDEKLYHEGVSVITVEEDRSKLTFLKSLNFLPNVVARGEAEEKNAFEAIFVQDGKVMEGTVSNVFVIKERTIKTSPLEGILSGITRAFVLRLIKDLGMFCEEKVISKEEFYQADEVFLTNSVMEILPVKSIDDRQVGEKTPGEITNALMTRYKIVRQKQLFS